MKYLIESYKEFLNEVKFNDNYIENNKKRPAKKGIYQVIYSDGSKGTENWDGHSWKAYRPVAYWKEEISENNTIDYKTNKNEYTREGYTFYDSKGIGRNSTLVLKLNNEGYNKVKYLFDNNGRAKSNDLKDIKAEGSKWTLRIHSYKSSSGTMYHIYGVSGDYTFGNAPAYYNSKYAGNKKAAIKILPMFIEKYLK